MFGRGVCHAAGGTKGVGLAILVREWGVFNFGRIALGFVANAGCVVAGSSGAPGLRHLVELALARHLASLGGP